MNDKVHSQEDLSHLVNQLTGSFLAFQAILRGMIDANADNEEYIQTVLRSVEEERNRMKYLIPGEYAQEFEETAFRIMRSTQ